MLLSNCKKHSKAISALPCAQSLIAHGAVDIYATSGPTKVFSRPTWPAAKLLLEPHATIKGEAFEEENDNCPEGRSSGTSHVSMLVDPSCTKLAPRRF